MSQVKSKKVLFIPDCHIPYHDVSAFKLLHKLIKAWQPDIVFIMGDFLDAYSISSYGKDSDKVSQLMAETKAGKKELTAITALLGKKTQKIILEGNHEYRFRRYISDNAPALQGITTIPRLLGAEKLGWEWVPYKSSYKLGAANITHDLGKAGKTAHISAATDYGDCVVIGHTHRAGITYAGDGRGRKFFGLSCGWLGDHEAIDYMHIDKARMDWMQGVGFARVLPDGFIVGGFAPFYEGKTVIEGITVSL